MIEVKEAEIHEAIASVHPGACYRNWEKSAAECKVCFIAESCSDATKKKHDDRKTLSSTPWPIESDKRPHLPKFEDEVVGGLNTSLDETKDGPDEIKEQSKPLIDPFIRFISEIERDLFLKDKKEKGQSALYQFTKSKNEDDVVLTINVSNKTGRMRVSTGENKVTSRNSPTSLSDSERLASVVKNLVNENE